MCAYINLSDTDIYDSIFSCGRAYLYMVRKNPMQMHTKPNIGGKGGATTCSST